MKLLSKTSATATLKKQNEDLIETNIRLRKYEKDVIERLNAIKENYEPDKVAKLKEFEAFCQDILQKKSKLLEELKGIEQAIEKKKELYYALIAKDDALAEKLHHVKEEEKKLDLRVAFVDELERKFQEKQLTI